MDKLKEIERRLDNLERLLNSYIRSQSNKEFYNEADKSGLRFTDGVHGEEIATNATDVADTRSAIEELYELFIEGE